MKTQISLGFSILALAFFAVPAHSQDNFTSSGSSVALPGNGSTVPAGTYFDYHDAANWDGGVPNLNDTTNTAVIGDGNNVGYFSGEHGDLVISGGAILYITSGTLTQVDGGSWLDIGRNGGFGNLVINGGVLNQGTVGSNPFNIESTNDTFTISSGTFNGNPAQSWTLGNPNLTWLQTGGVVNGPGAGQELDINSGAQMTINGGQFNVTRLMNLSNSVDAINFGGGIFYDGAAGFGGWYGANVNNFNFTTASTGTMEFAYGGGSSFADYASALAQANSWLTAGDISYDNTADPSAFTVADDGNGNMDISLIPEPSSYALIGLGSLGLYIVFRRKARLVS